jgi:ribosomal protein L19E
MVAKAVGEKSDDRLREAITQLSELKLVNLAVRAGKAHRLKTISCLLINRYRVLQRDLLNLRENTNFTKQNHIDMFMELIHTVESY